MNISSYSPVNFFQQYSASNSRAMELAMEQGQNTLTVRASVVDAQSKVQARINDRVQEVQQQSIASTQHSIDVWA